MSRKRKCRCNPAGVSYVDMGATAAVAGGLGYAEVKNAKDAATVALMRGVDQKSGLEVAHQGLKHFELKSGVLLAAGIAASFLGRPGSRTRGLGSMLAAGGASMYLGGLAAGITTIRSAEKFLPA